MTELQRLPRPGIRLWPFVFILAVSLGLMPTAAAHGGHVAVNGVHLAQWYALIPLGLGISLAGASIYLPRFLRPQYAHYTLAGVFLGLVLAVIGAIGLVQLSPVEWYSVQPPIPRALYDTLALIIGLGITVASVLVGQWRWPQRPRYTGLGLLLGLWVAYPGLMAGLNTVMPGLYTPTNPLGYLIVLSLPIALGYILWRDARGVLEQLWANRTTRRFGSGVGLLASVFFVFSTGMLTVVPDEGVGLSWSHGFITTMPVQAPLVVWTTVEFWVPAIPLSGMVSLGTALLFGVLGTLIGMNAALIASRWPGPTSADASSSTAGAAGIAAPNACCCCGPVFSQLAVVALGPSAAAPIYLLFADPASPLGALFFVGSVALLTGALLRGAATLNMDHCESSA